MRLRPQLLCGMAAGRRLTRALQWSGWHLMSSYVGWVSRWVTSSVCRGVVSSEAEWVRSPEGRFATLEQGGEVVCCRGSRRGGLERGGDCPAGPTGGPDGPYHRAGLWAECELGLFGSWRGLLVLLRELKPSSNPSFPSDRKKTVGLGLSRL
jgi:hypothetical protein